jgi:hypothetical protein
MPLADHLQQTLTSLRHAFPTGVPSRDYLALLVVLHDHFSEENLAALVAELIDGETAVVANDAAAARSVRRPRQPDVERVRAALTSHGLTFVESDW